MGGVLQGPTSRVHDFVVGCIGCHENIAVRLLTTPDDWVIEICPFAPNGGAIFPRRPSEDGSVSRLRSFALTKAQANQRCRPRIPSPGERVARVIDVRVLCRSLTIVRSRCNETAHSSTIKQEQFAEVGEALRQVVRMPNWRSVAQARPIALHE